MTGMKLIAAVSIAASYLSAFSLVAQVDAEQSRTWLQFVERNGFTLTFAVASAAALLWVLKKAGDVHLEQIKDTKARLTTVEEDYKELNNGHRQKTEAVLASAAKHMEDSAKAREMTNQVLSDLGTTIKAMRPCGMSANDLERYAAIIRAREEREGPISLGDNPK